MKYNYKMKDLDIEYFKYVWKPEINNMKGCEVCALRNFKNDCPTDCDKNGAYHMLDEFESISYDTTKRLKEGKIKIGLTYKKNHNIKL
jgi:hypothetical protein